MPLPLQPPPLAPLLLLPLPSTALYHVRSCLCLAFCFFSATHLFANCFDNRALLVPPALLLVVLVLPLQPPLPQLLPLVPQPPLPQPPLLALLLPTTPRQTLVLLAFSNSLSSFRFFFAAAFLVAVRLFRWPCCTGSCAPSPPAHPPLLPLSQILPLQSHYIVITATATTTGTPTTTATSTTTATWRHYHSWCWRRCWCWCRCHCQH